MIGGEIGRPASNSTGPGTPTPMPNSSPGGVARSTHSVEERLDASEHGVGPGGDVRRLGRVREDPAREVGDGDVDARRAEIRHEQVPRVGAEAHGARRAAAGRRADAALGDEPVVGERGRAAARSSARLSPVASTSSARVHEPRRRT